MAPNKKWQDKLTTWGAQMVADTARLRKTEETTPAEWWQKRHRKRTRNNEQVPHVDPDKERKNWYTGGQASWQGQAQTQRHQGHSEQEVSNGGATHRQNTNQNGTEYITKILMREVGSTNHSTQRIQRWKIKRHKRQYMLATSGAEQRHMERQRTRIRKENGGDSSSSLKKQKENKKKAAATFQEIHEGFLVGQKSFW